MYMQHMVLSLSIIVPGGLSVHILSENCTDYYLFIKYYSPLHISSLKCSSSGGYSCIHAAYVLSLSMRVPGGLSVHSLSEN